MSTDEIAIKLEELANENPLRELPYYRNSILSLAGKLRSTERVISEEIIRWDPKRTFYKRVTERDGVKIGYKVSFDHAMHTTEQGCVNGLVLPWIYVDGYLWVRCEECGQVWKATNSPEKVPWYEVLTTMIQRTET